MLADVFPERSRPPELNWRRTSVGIAVALLHFIILYGLLHGIVMTRRAVPASREITILFPEPPKTPEKNKEEDKKPPSVTAVEPDNTAPITIPPVTTVKPHSTEDDGIGRLGRYLNNCSAGNYNALSPQEWANCLGGMATQDRNGDTIRLGDVRTLWEKQHPKKVINPKEANGFVECARSDPRYRMGVPCFQYSGDRPSIANGQQ
jgi:hypothetical protein